RSGLQAVGPFRPGDGDGTLRDGSTPHDRNDEQDRAEQRILGDRDKEQDRFAPIPGKDTRNQTSRVAPSKRSKLALTSRSVPGLYISVDYGPQGSAFAGVFWLNKSLMISSQPLGNVPELFPGGGVASLQP